MLSDPRLLFGVYSFSAYNPTTYDFYGTAKVLGEISVGLTGELVELRGGASSFPWGIENGPINTELSCKVKQYEAWMIEVFLGKAPTENSAETSGNVSTLTNRKGTSVVATDGIASVAVIPSTGAANLKAGKYIVKVMSATTVNIYAASDIDFNRGTDAEFQDDDLKVLAANVTITQSSNTDVASLGIRLAGDSGTIAMVVGDTASFEVRPINSKSMVVTVGAPNDVFPEFGALLYAQQRSNQEITEFDVFRCKAIGMPFTLSEKTWSETDLSMKAFYSSSRGGVFSMRHITPT